MGALRDDYLREGKNIWDMVLYREGANCKEDKVLLKKKFPK